MEIKVDTEHLTPFETKKLFRELKEKDWTVHFKAVELISGWVFSVHFSFGEDDLFFRDVYLSENSGLVKTYLTFSDIINVAVFITGGAQFSLRVVPQVAQIASDRALKNLLLSFSVRPATGRRAGRIAAERAPRHGLGSILGAKFSRGERGRRQPAPPGPSAPTESQREPGGG